MADRLELARRWLGSRRLPLVAVLLALLLSGPSLWGGLALDDFAHRAAILEEVHAPPIPPSKWDLFRFVSGDEADRHAAMDSGIVPWWTVSGLRLAFFRPLTVATHRFDYLVWPHSPPLMHAHSLAWLLVMLLLAAHCYRRFFGAAWPAGLATLLFALDDAHGIPAAWVANRGTLIATTLCIAMLVLHDKHRRDGLRLSAAAAWLAFAAALLAGEIAIGAFGFVLAYALFRDTGDRRGRLLSLAPYVVIALGWKAAHSALGYGTANTTLYADPVREPLAFGKVLVERFPPLLLSEMGGPPASLLLLGSPTVRWLWWAGALLAMLGFAWVLRGLLRADAPLRFWATAAVVPVVPCCASLANDRLLVISAFAVMGLTARLAQLVVESSAPKRDLKVVLGVWLASQAVLSPLLLPVNAHFAAALGRSSIRAQADLPPNTKTLIVVSTPEALYCVGIPSWKGGRMNPARLRCLASSETPVVVKRQDARSLRITPEAGFFTGPLAGFFRAPDLPLTLGEKITVDGMTVTIESLTADGRPQSILARFDQSLDSDEYLLRVMDESGLSPFELPPVGGSRTIPGLKLADLLH